MFWLAFFKVWNLLTKRSPLFKYLCDCMLSLDIFTSFYIRAKNNGNNWKLLFRHHLFLFISIQMSQNYLFRLGYVIIFASHTFVLSTWIPNLEIDKLITPACLRRWKYQTGSHFAAILTLEQEVYRLNKNDFNKCYGRATQLGISIPDFVTRDWNNMNQLSFCVNKPDFYDA